MSGGGDRLNPLTFISLFSGIGGLDLGLERAGFKLIAHSEIEPYCCRVHEKHWPDVPNLGDVRTVDWSGVERPDLICGGYPCQPFSLAGARRGETDERHLWPAMRDAISVLRPRFALLENVPGHLSLGFDRVLGDLADCGYDAEWDCIPAAAVGAPHLRYRLFVVAYPQDSARGRGAFGGQSWDGRPRVHGSDGSLADPDSWRREVLRVTQSRRIEGSRGRFANGRGALRELDDTAELADTAGERREDERESIGASATDPRFRCDGDATVPDSEGFSLGAGLRAGEPGGIGWGRSGDIGCEGHAWAVEPSVGRVAHGVPCRVDRLRALGNAVVPQVAQWIGEQLLNSLEVRA